MKKVISFLFIFIILVGCGPEKYYRFVVREGDSIQRIAEDINLNDKNLKRFAEYNNIPTNEILSGGMRVNIPEDILSDEWREIFRKYSKARVYSSKEDYQKAETLYREIEVKGVLLPEMMYDMALVYLNQGIYEKSFRYLLDVLDEFPDDTDVLFTLGMAYYNSGLLIKSAEIFKQGQKLDTNGSIHFGLSLVQMDMGDYSSAYENISKTLDLMDKEHPLYQRVEKYNKILKKELGITDE
jgi:tetratricopeptide (TPR) repeat protein